MKLSGKRLSANKIVAEISKDNLINLSVVFAAFVLSISLATLLAVMSATLLLNNMAASEIDTAVLKTPTKARDKK